MAPLSPAQAAESLKDIEKTGRHSAAVYGYAMASPFFVTWGLVWMAGYSGSAFLAAHGQNRQIGGLWLLLSGLGLLACAVIGYRQHHPQVEQGNLVGRREGMRFFWAFLIIVLFINAAYRVLGFPNTAQQAAFIPLVVAMFYAIIGLWRGPRLLITGLALTGLTLLGYFWLREYFLYWMAVIGGGSLVLAGLWLRQV